MRKFLLKLSIFLLIPISLSIATSILLPLNTFTFRAWESLKPSSPDKFDGSFYPNQSLQMVEEGDLGHGTQWGIARDNLFVTDKYGERYRNLGYSDSIDIVIEGDSMIVGSSLDQSEIIAEQLAHRLQVEVYTLGTVELPGFFRHPYFAEHPPKVLVWELLEFMNTSVCPQELAFKPNAPPPARWIQDLQVLFDLSERNLIYARTYINTQLRDRAIPIIVNEDGMLFFDVRLDPPYNDDPTATAQSIARCADWFNEQGIKMIFLPIVSKEAIYFDQIPREYRSDISIEERQAPLRAIIDAVQAANIPVVDTLQLFADARQNGINAFLVDDTHMSAAGTAIIAEELARIIVEQDMLAE